MPCIYAYCADDQLKMMRELAASAVLYCGYIFFFLVLCIQGILIRHACIMHTRRRPAEDDARTGGICGRGSLLISSFFFPDDQLKMMRELAASAAEEASEAENDFQVCLICMPYVYALCVCVHACLICMPPRLRGITCRCALYLCLICTPHFLIIIICMPLRLRAITCRCALYLCLICTPHIFFFHYLYG